MEDVNRILVVSRDTKYCRKAVHSGISLANKYGAELYVLHVLDDARSLEGIQEEEYQQRFLDTRAELAAAIAAENDKGLNVKELIKEGYPSSEIFQVIKEEKIDLLLLLAHEEGHLEHILFGRSNDELIRKMPCSIMMVKEPASNELVA